MMQPAGETLETWRIPTERQRRQLLLAILRDGTTPGIYALCDLLGWLGSPVDLATPASLHAFDDPPEACAASPTGAAC